MRHSSSNTSKKLPMHLPKNRASGGAGATRYASSTPLRSSRAQDWLSAMTVDKRNAVHTSPPAILRDSSTVGLQAKLKMTTTSSATKCYVLSTSRDHRYQSRTLL